MTKPAPTKQPARRKPAAKRKGNAKPKFTKIQISNALTEAAGMITQAAAVLAKRNKTSCSRATVYNALERWPELKEHRCEVAEETKDIAETGLLKALKAEEPWAIKFYLTRKAKDRGYGVISTVEVSGINGGAIQSAVEHSVTLADISGKSSQELADIYRAACQHPTTVKH